MKKVLIGVLPFFLLLVIACHHREEARQQSGNKTDDYLEIPGELYSGLLLVKGEVVYVPVYSEIYSTDVSKKTKLTATLSIRNTNTDKEMIVSVVDYYDTHGKKIRQYIDKPIRLKALQTVNYVVEYKEAQGGTGANFIVEWAAEEDVTEPIIQAVMIGTSSSLGISFVCEGKVIKYIGQ